MEDRGYLSLADAIVARAAEDYVFLLKRKLRLANTLNHQIQKSNVEKELRELETWFRSEWCYELKENWDAEAIIELCRKKAEREFRKKGEKK